MEQLNYTEVEGTLRSIALYSILHEDAHSEGLTCSGIVFYTGHISDDGKTSYIPTMSPVVNDLVVYNPTLRNSPVFPTTLTEEEFLEQSMHVIYVTDLRVPFSGISIGMTITEGYYVKLNLNINVYYNDALGEMEVTQVGWGEKPVLNIHLMETGVDIKLEHEFGSNCIPTILLDCGGIIVS